MHLSKRLFLEFCVTHCQHLVDNQNLRVQVRRDRKGQPNVHAAAIAFDRRVEKLFYLREGHNLIEFRFDFCPRHTKDGAIEKNVLAASQLTVETGAHFEEARNSAAQNRAPSGRLGDPAQDFQQGRFAGPISSDDAEYLAPLDLEAHISQSPEFLDLVALHNLFAAD